VNRRQSLGHGSSLVVIHDFDVIGASFVPTKADSVLVVDPDAVLPDPIPFQGFQPVARPRRMIAQRCRDVQGIQPAARSGFDVRETGNPLSAEQPFGIGAGGGPLLTLSSARPARKGERQ
jgi:hypothetical protein